MDRKIEVVNRLLVHALCTHFAKNKQWDAYFHII